MEDLKNKIEALLFATGKATSIEEIKRVCKTNDDNLIQKALQDLKIDYDNRDSSLILINEGNRWKIVTKENYFNVVKKVVTETELSKSLMETLAVIAWKYPIKQCDLIKIRTNKAYAHLDELEQLGYISRQKFGRTKLIKLTDRFFSYFDLPPEKLSEKFSDFNQIAQAISNKELHIKQMKEEHKQQIEEIKKSQETEEQKQKQEIEKQAQEIDLIDRQGNKIELEQYETTPKKESSIEQKLGLEVYESKEEEKKQQLEDVAEQESKDIEEEKEEQTDNSSEEPAYNEETAEKQESDAISEEQEYKQPEKVYVPKQEQKDANDVPDDFLDDEEPPANKEETESDEDDKESYEDKEDSEQEESQ